jgi:VIT1/CCC1 family predicted Fe2+/Mn2+ transporter
MLEFLVEVVGEFLLQIFVEIMVEMGFHSVGQAFHKERSPVVSAFGHALFGAAVGIVTLFVFPQSLVHGSTMRWLNLILTPIIVGACMSAVGAWRGKHGMTRMRIDTFWYGYLFAMALAVVRFFGAN